MIKRQDEVLIFTDAVDVSDMNLKTASVLIKKIVTENTLIHVHQLVGRLTLIRLLLSINDKPKCKTRYICRIYSFDSPFLDASAFLGVGVSAMDHC